MTMDSGTRTMIFGKTKRKKLALLSKLYLSICMTMLFFYQGVGQKWNSGDLQLGLQTWSFRFNTLEEALIKMDSVGITYFEGYPGQTIGGGIDGTLDYRMGELRIEQVKALIKKHNKVMISFGVLMNNIPNEDLERLFSFAKSLGLKTIGIEPRLSQIHLLSNLADQYGVNVAIHQHMRPMPYWEPSLVLDAVKNAGPRVGALADVGHWLESGLDPIACLRQLQGHIIELHLKDENKRLDGFYDMPSGNRVNIIDSLIAGFSQMAARGMINVPFGTGVVNMPEILRELKRQQFKGFSLIEYEYKFENNVPEVKQSVDFFNRERERL